MSEHDLIMNDVQLLSPEDAKPTAIQDTPSQIVSRKVYGDHVKKRIKTLDARKYSAYRIGSSTIELREDDVWETYTLDIRSIPGDIMDKIGKEYSDTVASFPMKLNPETGVHEQDFWAPQAIELRGKFVYVQNNYALDKVLYGTLIEIKDADGLLVWDAGRGITDNRQAAIDTLWAMGLTWDHIRIIANDIDKLMAKIEQEEQETIEKK